MKGNRCINFEKFMNEPDYLDDVSFRGFLPEEKKRSNENKCKTKEHVNEKRVSIQDEKNIALMLRGIVPYSKFCKAVLPASSFSRILGIGDKF